MAADARPPFEMVSGPDLGGGFLHQLSIDRVGESTTFTHHAQEGGQDAGGPGRGPLDVLGFVHPPSPCMFGGPRCWHRRLLLPFSELPKVRFAYQRFRFVLASMLAQAYDDTPMPVGAVVDELTRRLAPKLEEEKIPWFVGGSTAGALLGAPLRPHDIDVGTSRAGVDRIGQLLGEYLIEPVAPTDWGADRLVRGGRAFVGAPQEGGRVEWSVPLDAIGAGEFGGDPARVHTLEVTVAGHSVRVSRPEYGVVRAAERQRANALPLWIGLARKIGPDPKLLEELLERTQLSPASRARVRSAVVD
jgi:hypothetical protein